SRVVSVPAFCFVALVALLRSSTLCPYTTLFRSAPGVARLDRQAAGADRCGRQHHPGQRLDHGQAREPARRDPTRGAGDARAEIRSEEHTSELQSRENLVCRLLLEKKKEKT